LSRDKNAKIGLCSYSYRWAVGSSRFKPRKPMTVEEFIIRAAENGYSGVQIADNLPLPSLEKDYLKKIRALTEENNMFIELGMRGTDPDLIRKMLEACQLVGSKILRIVASPHPTIPNQIVVPPLAEELDLYVENMTKIADESARAGIRIAIENHSGITTPSLLEVIDRINHPYVGICLDTANSLACLENPLHTVNLLAPHTFSVHLKDYEIVTRFPGPGFEVVGTSLGRGALPVKQVLDLLQSKCPQATIHVETFMPLMDTVEDTLRVEEQAVKESIELFSCL
jgi:sugar phosphate isomerase/epimerase